MRQSKKIIKFFGFIYLLTLLISSILCAQHFPFEVPNTPNSMIFYGDVFTIDEVMSEVGDEIAVFDQQNIICGHVTITHPGFFNFSVYGDDSGTPTDDEGATINEDLTFKIWDVSAELEITLDNSMFIQKQVYTAPQIETIPPRFLGDNVLRGMGIAAKSAPPPPAITEISPEIVFTSGGGTLQITGTGFQEGAVVTIDGITTTINNFSITLLTCDILPNENIGTVEIMVINPDGLTATTNITYEYNPPAITEISPAHVTTDGLTITIMGEYFREGATVSISGITSNALYVSPTTIQCYVPPYTVEESVELVLQNDDGKQALATFQYVFYPKIDSVTPSKGHIDGGTEVIISGAHFDNGLTITMADENITPISVTENQVIFTTLPYDTDNIQSVDITITNPNGRDTMKEGAFTYKTLIANFNIISEKTGDAPFIAVLEDASIGEIEEWEWHFGGDNPEWQNESELLNIEYSAPGIYPITLLVRSTQGEDISEIQTIEDISEIQTITVEKYDVEVDFFSPSRLEGQPPLRVKFINETTFADALDITWTWTFGDGNTSDAESPEYTYNQAGIYTVSLTADVEGFDEPITYTKMNFIEVVQRQISGKIVNATGIGITNCEVAIVVPGKDPLKITTTDENGNFSFVELPLEEHLHLAVHPAKESLYFPTHTKEPLSTIEDIEDNASVELTLYTGILVGKLQRQSGEGIEGVEISLFNDDAFILTHSTSTGDYTLTGIPAGEYYLSAWFEKTGTEFFFANAGTTVDIDDAQKISITAGTNKANPYQADMILETGVTISGRVEDSNGDPVPDILVNAWSEGLMVGGNATTNGSGYYTITALPESDANTSNYIVEIHPEGKPYQAFNRKNNPENANLVPAPSSDINFVIQTGLSIAGTVTLATELSQDEKIEIIARSKKANIEHFTQANANGKYTLTGLPPANDYIVFAHAPGYPVQFYDGQQDVDDATPIDLSYDDAFDIDFDISNNYYITGSVSGPSFDPTKDDPVWVHVWSEDTKTGGDIPTKSDGTYEIFGLVDTDDYIIYILDPRFGQAYYKDDGTTVYSYIELNFEDGAAKGIPPSETPRNIQLPTELYSIKGKVTLNGQPFPGIQIEAWSGEDGGHWKSTLSVSHLDKDDANFELTGLIPETYEINIISEKFILDNPVMVTVTNGDVLNVDLSIQNPDRSISGTIYNLAAGSRVWISAFSESEDYAEEIMIVGVGTDIEIAYTINGLKPAVDYVVHLHALDYPDIVYNGKTSWFKANRVNLSNRSKSGIDFTLSTNLASISGKVNVPNNAQKGEEIWIDAFSDSLASSSATMISVAETCTNIDGCDYVYTIKGLKKGDDYVVVVNSDKYSTLFYDNQSSMRNLTPVDISAGDREGINFKLNTGYYIDGTIKDNNGDALSGIDVEAWSESTNSWGIAKSGSDGSFYIEGLSSASDYVVQAFIPDEPPFIYKSNENHTRDIDYATSVPSKAEGSTSVEIVIVSGYTVSGLVQNESGKGIQGVIVAIESQTQNIGNHAKTNDAGIFTIKGLPGNISYNIAAEPGPSSTYMRKERTVTIDDSSITVNFTLSEGFEVSGIIRNESNIPIAEAEVFLRSDATGYEEWAVTDVDGEYSFNGVPKGSDYDIMVETQEEYLIYIKNDLEVTGHLIQTTQTNITLEAAAGNIRGYVFNDSSIALSNVIIYINSDNADFQRFDITTNNKGYYEANGLPNANDYIVVAIPDTYTQYAEESVSGKSPGDVVNFELSSGGTISGVVQTSAGTKLEGVLVTLDSASLQVTNEMTRTDTSGNYEFNSLKSSSASDYIVTVYPEDIGYPVTDRTGLNIGKTVDFNLTKGSQTTISGSLKDNNDANPTMPVMIRIYTSVGNIRVGQSFVQEDGTFEFTSLDASQEYVLRFLTQDGTLKHFVGENGTLNNDSPGTFSTGTEISVLYDGTW